MNNIYGKHIVRAFFLVLVQVLVLKRLSGGWAGEHHLNVFVYPLFIMLFPIKIRTPILMLIALGLGLTVDGFYNSWGLHASASVFIAYIRPVILKRLSPRDGYNVKQNPTMNALGWRWFLAYCVLFLFFHLLFYFSIEAFTPIYFLLIVKKLFFSYIVSVPFVMIIMVLFNPK